MNRLVIKKTLQIFSDPEITEVLFYQIDRWVGNHCHLKQADKRKGLLNEETDKKDQ